MNYFSSQTALLLLIVTTLMWGSWFQFSKRLKDYPVEGFVLLLYTFSLILVWGVIALIKPYFLTEPIIDTIRLNGSKCFLIILCGIIWSLGTQVNIHVIKKVGMILSTSITSTAGIMLGTAISVYFGGLREGQSVEKIFLGAVVLLAATIIGQYSALLRDRDNGSASNQVAYKAELHIRVRNLIILLMSSCLLTPCYSLAQSAFVKTDLRPDGIPQLVCIGLLAIGSFLGSLIVSGAQLTIKRRWNVLFSSKKVVLMAFVSAICHYGGNVLYALCAPILSYAIAWPIGTSYSFWHYIWGIGYGEYKNTTTKTKVCLGIAMIGFAIGILILC